MNMIRRKYWLRIGRLYHFKSINFDKMINVYSYQMFIGVNSPYKLQRESNDSITKFHWIYYSFLRFA